MTIIRTVWKELLDPLRGYLAKALADITPGDLQYCFFTNGGAEAVEMALKLARIATGGRWFISTVGAFHGKSMGAISMGGKSTYRTPYIPMVQQVQHVQYGIADDVRRMLSPEWTRLLLIQRKNLMYKIRQNFTESIFYAERHRLSWADAFSE